MPIMDRWISIEFYSGKVIAMSEDEWQEAFDNDESPLDGAEIACWVWQYAETRQEAIDQHYDKHGAWETDIQAGAQRDTY